MNDHDNDNDHYGHELMARREMLGISRDQLAHIVGVTRPRTVKLWEEREEAVPADVWEAVDALLDKQDRAVGTALRIVDEYDDVETVTLPYWRDQAEYDEYHHVDDGGTYTMANATNRRLAAALDAIGIYVEWVRGCDNPVPRMR